MSSVLNAADSIVDKCMVNGERGWPPHSGGIVRKYGDPVNGPLQIAAYGAPDYRKLYDAAGVLDGGYLSGHSPEAEVFMKYIGNRGRPDTSNGASTTSINQPANQQCTRSCSKHDDCSAEIDSLCVASNGSFANPQLLNGCCKLNSYSQTTEGVQLLRNESASQGNKPVDTGTISLPPFPVSDFGCACNCTYVSQSCCGIKSGLVSEAASLKLGVLEPPNSTACCNTGSGSFSTGPRKIGSTYC